jgi:acyl carrier protein
MNDLVAQDQIALDALATILRRVSQQPLPDLTPDTYLDEIPGMDSLRVLHVVAMMEEEFGVEIDTTALDRLYQVTDVLRAVRTAKRGADGGGGSG